MRAVFPDLSAEDLLEILRRRDTLLAREREALAGLWSGDQAILSPGHRFLEANPDLKEGIIVSLHQGPYPMLLEPFLNAGMEPTVLLNPRARDSFQAGTRHLVKHLKFRKSIQWLTLGEKDFVRKLIRAAGSSQPVIVYLDGNTGNDGMKGTRKWGVRYRLPGRDILLRNGLARLVCRFRIPVHQVALHWDEAGELQWCREASHVFERGADPDDVTRRLFDWIFGQIMSRPEQWHYWDMLKEASACFATTGLTDQEDVPVGLREDYQEAFRSCMERSPATVRLILDKAVEVWPGDVLADLTEDRFYPAAGLQDEDLDCVRNDEPTLEELMALHGEAWVRFHGLRLCLLGMARLGG